LAVLEVWTQGLSVLPLEPCPQPFLL
jgi:hypothetical protein